MSSPQTETTSAPAEKAGKKSGKKPVLTPSQQAEVDRLVLQNAERAGRETLGDAQLALGRARRLEKAARKDPAVAEILDQNKVMNGVIVQLREKLDAAEESKISAMQFLEEAGKVNKEQHDELAAARVELGKLREQLAAALKPKAD